MRFRRCVVKVLWSGTWHSKTIEPAAARFFWNVEACPLITQHSDSREPQVVYKDYGGAGIGYNSDMREIVGDSVLTAPMFEWGPIYNVFVQTALDDAWSNTSVARWPGAAEGAVTLGPFSPRVEPITVQRVQIEREKLKAAAGDKAFQHIFCGPLLKRWAYAHANGSTGPRASVCGSPIWRRLDPPEQINLRHYRTSAGERLPADRTEPLSTDCLWGMDWAGQALLSDAYPSDSRGTFDDNYVFNDYLVDGAELVAPCCPADGTTANWGTVYDGPSPDCAYGDHFYEPPPVPEVIERLNLLPRPMIHTAFAIT
eukprot:4083243-Prymnesium_polylepis.1